MSGLFYIHQVLRIKVDNQLKKQDLIEYLSENLTINDISNLDEQVFGFRVLKNIHFPPYISTDNEYNRIANDLIVIEYFWRKKSQKKVFNIENNQIQDEQQIDVLEDNRDYIFIIFPNLLIFKGAEEAYEAVWDNFFEIIKPVIQIIRNYAFNNEFFLKLMEILSLTSKEIDNNFRLDHVLDLNFEGFRDFLEVNIEIRHLYKISKSVIALIALLIKFKIKSGNFDFCLKDLYFTMELKNTGAMIIKQQRGDFKDMPHNQRAFHGCYIVCRFIKFYDKWELLRDTEMVINPEFRKSIIRSLEDNNIFPGIED